MALNDVYRITDTAEQYGQKMLNVYFYQQTATPAGFEGAASVAQAYVDQVLPKVAIWQATDVVHTGISVQNLFNESDGFEDVISVAGSDGNPADSSFDAVGFRLVGSNHAVRSGSKRYPGIVDGDVVNGVVTGSGTITSLNALATQLHSILTFGLLTVATLTPVIVKRIKVGTEYELPSTLEEAVISIVVDALFAALVTTQNSRKIGRGE